MLSKFKTYIIIKDFKELKKCQDNILCNHIVYESGNNTSKNMSNIAYYVNQIREKKEYDNVNRPSHYCTGKFECIDVMLETQGKQAVLDFCLCNAFKYLYRHNGKNGYEDIKKAKWYLDKYIELAEK